MGGIEERELLGDKLGICVVDVTTAVPLDDGLRQLITEKAEADLGRRAVLRERIDASILPRYDRSCEPGRSP